MTWVDILMTLLCSAWLIMMAYCGVMFCKTNVTYRNVCIIVEATYLYNMNLIDSGLATVSDLILYEDIKDLDTALYEYFDWGYKNLLPPDKYALVEPYIDEAIIKAKKEGWIK